MPAHRSDAEKEIRDAVIAELRRAMRDPRIMHEVNIGGGMNRVDVLAVDPAHIVAVEIKSKKDTLSRLPDQIKAMKRVTPFVIAAIHEKHCVATKTNQWSAEFEKDGEFFFLRDPPEADYAFCWRFPRQNHPSRGWRELKFWPQTTLLSGAIEILHADELRELVDRHGLPTSYRSNMRENIAALRWGLTGRELTYGICDALRRRTLCAEADDPKGGNDADNSKGPKGQPEPML